MGAGVVADEVFFHNECQRNDLFKKGENLVVEYCK